MKFDITFSELKQHILTMLRKRIATTDICKYIKQHTPETHEVSCVEYNHDKGSIDIAIKKVGSNVTDHLSIFEKTIQ